MTYIVAASQLISVADLSTTLYISTVNEEADYHKCPVELCEAHITGFARKDKLLNHIIVGTYNLSPNHPSPLGVVGREVVGPYDYMSSTTT
jgi:hypothetical protein